MTEIESDKKVLSFHRLLLNLIIDFLYKQVAFVKGLRNEHSFGHNNTSCTIRHCLLMSIVQEVFVFVIEPVVQLEAEFNSTKSYKQVLISNKKRIVLIKTQNL